MGLLEVRVSWPGHPQLSKKKRERERCKLERQRLEEKLSVAKLDFIDLKNDVSVIFIFIL